MLLVGKLVAAVCLMNYTGRTMFTEGFLKIAVSYASLDPEEVAERVAEKYPYAGAVYGAGAGAAAGGAKKRTAKGTLIGAAAGGAVGAAAGAGKKAWEKYKARRLRREVAEWNLRATPRRHSYQEHQE